MAYLGGGKEEKVMFCVGWKQKVIAFDYILWKKEMSLALLSSQEGCFVFFCSLEEKTLHKAFAPQFEHIIGLGLHSIH